jgi:hypothetical protein
MIKQQQQRSSFADQIAALNRRFDGEKKSGANIPTSETNAQVEKRIALQIAHNGNNHVHTISIICSYYH